MRNALAICVSVAVAMAAVVAAASAATAAPAATPEMIDIPRDDGALKAVVFRPEGAGPFPAVVGLHSCAGLFSNGAVAVRYRDWAQHLTKAGFVVLYPDSYGSRGLGSQCAVPNRAGRTDRERVADANAARRWLQHQPYVEPDKVTLLGWSTGGISVLWAVRRLPTIAKDDSADFRSAVALYPGCRPRENPAR